MIDYKWLDHLPALIGEIGEDSIVSRTVFKDAQIKVVLFGFAAGQSLSEHTAGTPAIVHFLTGEAKVTVRGDEKQARAGSWLWMPAREPHSVTATTDTTMLLILLKCESALEGVARELALEQPQP